jgi:hypothetical protein
VRLGPGEQAFGRGRHVLDPLRRVFDQRAGRIIDDRHAIALAELVHVEGGRQIVGVQVRQRAAVIRIQLRPQVLIDAGGQAVEAGQHDVDVEMVGVLLGLDLAGEFRRRRLGVVELGDVLRMGLAVVLEALLGQGERAADVDDVDRLCCRRQRRGIRRASMRRACDEHRPQRHAGKCSARQFHSLASHRNPPPNGSWYDRSCRNSKAACLRVRRFHLSEAWSIGNVVWPISPHPDLSDVFA